jgi:hypothetical protein
MQKRRLHRSIRINDIVRAITSTPAIKTLCVTQALKNVQSASRSHLTLYILHNSEGYGELF